MFFAGHNTTREVQARIGGALLALALTGAAPDQPPPERKSESVAQAMCRLIDGAAHLHQLPPAFLTRLIWRESSFRPGVVSRAGAQGVAQFMPRTAGERGLLDPFDPEQAIPEAARFLSDLKTRFGNLGLAAAAYNGGPNRVSAWLAGTTELRQETRDYVRYITGRAVEEWIPGDKASTPGASPGDASAQSCMRATALLRVPGQMIGSEPALASLAPLAPWGVQLAGNFSKQQALASYARAHQSYASIIGDLRPMVIGTRLRSRGLRAYYRVRVPQATRAAAVQLCDRIRARGGACVVLPT